MGLALWAAGLLAAALYAAGCTLQGDTAPGDFSYWNGAALNAGKSKTVSITGLPSPSQEAQAGAYGQVKLFSTQQTLAQLQIAEAPIQSGPEPEPIDGSSKSFSLYLGKTPYEWKSAGDYYVYFFFTPEPGGTGGEPGIYEYSSKVSFTEENYNLYFYSLRLMVPPEETAP